MQTWKLLRERPGPAGYLTVTTRTYAMPDDREADWDVLVGSRTVAVVAVTTDGDIVLTRQFRPGPARVLHELPGGVVDEREDVVDAAARELREETGYVAEQLTLVGRTWLAGYATHLRHAVLATGCRLAFDQRLDEDEFCEVVTMPMAGFLVHLRGGQLTDADMAWMCLDRLHPWTPRPVRQDGCMALHLATTDDGNTLLERDPLALLLGMQLDQQIPMEKAFTSPSVLAQRLGVPPGGRLDAAAIAALPPETLLEHFRTPPALHRFPGSMATRTQQLCQALVDDWGGDAANVWSGVDSGAELVRRIGSLPGFGEQKAKIFAALLAKQFGVTPEGWEAATGDYGKPGHRSIADVVDDASRVKVREFKKAKKAGAKASAQA